VRAKYDAISVDAPPRIEMATDVCHIVESILGGSRGAARESYTTHIFTAQCCTKSCGERTEENL